MSVAIGLAWGWNFPVAMSRSTHAPHCPSGRCGVGQGAADRPGRFHGSPTSDRLAGILVRHHHRVHRRGRRPGAAGGDGPTWLQWRQPASSRCSPSQPDGESTTRSTALSGVPATIRWRSSAARRPCRPDSGAELLPALAASLQRELRLEAVAIDVRTPDGWRREATSGPPTSYEHVVELSQRGEVVGRLVVGWEHGPSLRTRDERVLAELAGPLGLAVGWVRLAAELRRSSASIVSAREEERRRLRRDLHDGLGPALTGVSLGLRTAVRQLERSPHALALAPSRDLLDRVADEVDSLVIEVKRVVRDLRPTALDQLGLIDAVGEFTRTFSDDLEFHLTMPSAPIELPAAVEVAAYRIVTEAVRPIVRDAKAAQCWLSITTGPTVDIDVVDDGIGVIDGAPNGVGWTAMSERATELGGSVQVTRRDPHGTHIHVRIPVALP